MQVRVNSAHIEDLKSLLIAIGFQYREREKIMRKVRRQGYAVIRASKVLVIEEYCT